MANSPESSSAHQSQRISELQTGLAALQQKDYATAIVLLEPALTLPAKHPIVARAQMGLVVAYEKLAETVRAAELCQTLTQHENAQVRDWATQRLTILVEQYPELATFAPVAPAPSRPSTVPKGSEDTGFIPIEADTTAPNHPVVDEDATGFVPFAAPATPVDAIAPPPPRSHPEPPELTPASRSPRPAVDAAPSVYQPVWRQGDRAKSWKSLGKVKLFPLVVAQLLTAIALWFGVQQVFYWVVSSYGNAVLKILPKLGFRVAQSGPPLWTVPLSGVLVLVALVGSRWILDALLTVLDGLKPMNLSMLGTYSPEAARSLPRWCQSYKVSLPALGLLPTQAPLILTYGVMPNLSRIVVSQGLLEQLADDEIAALFANEIGHLGRWTVPILSAAVVVLQVPYTLYRIVAEWGNRKPSPITKASAIVLSSIAYGIFWLWRWIPLWLTRQRSLFSDRTAVELTGNPNGYTRALLKLAIGTAKDVQQQGQTSYLLDGWEILSPLGHSQATPLGSVYAHAPLEPILAWDRTNPYRHWLSLPSTHPPVGDRLHLLTLYAQHWQLTPELDWPKDAAPRSKKAGLSAAQWRSLLFQGAPYFGLALGFLIAFGLSSLGWIGLRANWDAVSWMAGDRTIRNGLPLVGFCLGTIIRINAFFPDIQPSLHHQAPSLPTLLTQVGPLPVKNKTVRLEGKLLGRSGISNVLNQDLWLHTQTGMVKLHCTSRFGPLGNLFPQANRPAALLKQPVTVAGWLRRGLHPWIDAETLRSSGGRISYSHHPVWSTIAAMSAALLGIWLILNI